MGVKMPGARDIERGELDVNGEEVRKSMEAWRAAAAARTGISGVAFMMGLVGIMGEGASGARMRG